MTNGGARASRDEDEGPSLEGTVRRHIIGMVMLGGVIGALVAAGIGVDWSGGMAKVVGGLYVVFVSALLGASVGLIGHSLLVPWFARRWVERAVAAGPEAMSGVMQRNDQNNGALVACWMETGPCRVFHPQVEEAAIPTPPVDPTPVNEVP